MKQRMKVKNWNKRTPKFWKRIGDVCIYSLPMLISAIMASPLNADARQWCMFLLTVILVAAKAITKFVAEDEDTN